MLDFKNVHIKKIKKISSKLKTVEVKDLEKFNQKIHNLLHKLFYGADEYLYSTLLFVKNKDILNHQFLFGGSLEDDKLRNYIEKVQNNLSRELRNTNETIGISNKIIDTKVNGVVLYKNENDDEITARVANGIDVAYNLKNIQISNKNRIDMLGQTETGGKFIDRVKTKKYYSNFIGDEKTLIDIKEKLDVDDIDLLKPILSLYALSIPKTESNFYSYFIRPNTSHDHYNGLFNLTLTRPLKTQELATINLILFYVFSEIALKETTENIEREANEKYQVELAHTINGNLGEALKLIKNGSKKFDIRNIDSDKISDVFKLLKRTERRGRVFLDLYYKRRKRKDFRYKKFSKIDFIDIINDALNNNISNSDSREKVMSIIKLLESNKFIFLKDKIKEINYKVEESLEILLYNSIHNAIKYSIDVDKLKIEINNFEDFFEIIIINDKAMEDDLKNSINNDFKNIKNFGFGLVTISKVVKLISNISVKVKVDKTANNTFFKITIKK